MTNINFAVSYCSCGGEDTPKCERNEYNIEVKDVTDEQIDKFRQIFAVIYNVTERITGFSTMDDRVIRALYYTTLVVFGGVKVKDIFILSKNIMAQPFNYKSYCFVNDENASEIYNLIRYGESTLKDFLNSIVLKQEVGTTYADGRKIINLYLSGEYEYVADNWVVKYKYKKPKECVEIEKINKKIIKRTTREPHFGSDIRYFYNIMEYRNKSHGHKKQNYCENFYYTTVSGELGIIKSKGHNTGKMLGQLLVRRGVIDKKTHQACLELNGKRDTYWIKGTIIKHNRVLDDIKKSLTPEQYKYLSIYFDKAENCDMIIDKKFDTAYAPKYRDNAVYEGDLCSSSSCMSERGDGQASSFYGKIPCCSVVRFERDGEQVGRCIMYEWKGKRHFIRIYGKPEYLPKMYKLLKAELKPGDLFGRQQCLDDLVERTDITDESTNMYLDGNYYGMVRSKDENDNAVYTMCTETTKHKVMEETGGNYNCMKSTSGEALGDIFEPEESDAYGVCDHCGAQIYEDDDEYLWIDDNLYCCSDCAHEAGYEQCDKCGEWGWGDNGIGTDYAWFCCKECANRAGYYECEVCGKWEYEDNLHEVKGMYDAVCDDCIEKLKKNCDIVKCDWCGCYEQTEDTYKMISKSDRQEVDICSDCHADSTYVQAHYDDIEQPKEDEDVDKE